jgi:hypothetical protein
MAEVLFNLSIFVGVILGAAYLVSKFIDHE